MALRRVSSILICVDFILGTSQTALCAGNPPTARIDQNNTTGFSGSHGADLTKDRSETKMNWIQLVEILAELSEMVPNREHPHF
jgi:hypothetical protein